MSNVSTHVLDTSLGRPASGIAVALEQQNADTWHALASHVTNADGRVQQMTTSALMPGTYRLTFLTDIYFASKKIDGLYPLVQITFLIREADAHYHIPLLLTANGYSTYRGS